MRLTGPQRRRLLNEQAPDPRQELAALQARYSADVKAYNARAFRGDADPRKLQELKQMQNRIQQLQAHIAKHTQEQQARGQAKPVQVEMYAMAKREGSQTPVRIPERGAIEITGSFYQNGAPANLKQMGENFLTEANAQRRGGTMPFPPDPYFYLIYYTYNGRLYRYGVGDGKPYESLSEWWKRAPALSARY